MVRELRNCRVCDSQMLRKVANMGERCVEKFPKPNGRVIPTAPLEVVWCSYCGLAQLGYSYLLDHGDSFPEDTVHDHVAQDELARKVASSVSLEEHDRLLEIGCGEGLMSEQFPGCTVVGCDQDTVALAKAMEKQRVSIGVPGCFRKASLVQYGKFKVIVAMGVLHTEEDPKTFLADCHDLLEDDGVLILQVPYWSRIVTETAIDRIDFQYKTYWSLSSLARALGRAGLDMQGVEELGDGSIRVYASQTTHAGSVLTGLSTDKQVALYARMQSLSLQEETLMFGLALYGQFRMAIGQKCSTLGHYIEAQNSEGAKVYAYGASERDICLLQALGLPKDLLVAVVDPEAPEEKRKRAAGGTGLPIVRKAAKATHLLMLPYYWKDQIELREQQWMARGGTMVTPLPHPSYRRLEEQVTLQ